jgi:hypothetical protein
MSDGIVIPLDVDDTKAKGKVARLKKDAAAAGKAYGQAGSQMARMGGPAGGALGRSIGGFQQGIGAGALGLGMAGGGMLLSAFLQRDGERMAMARDREARIQSRAADARTVMKAKDDLAAGGASYLQTIRSAGFRGVGTETLKGYTSMANDWGLSSEQGLGIWEAANDNQGVDPNDIAKGLAAGVLGNDPKTVAASILKFNGLNNAIAASENISPEQAGAAIESMRTNPLSLVAGEIGNAMNPVQNAQIDYALSGDTARVLENQARDTLDPGRKLMLDASQKAMDTVNQLQAAAASQSALGALLAEMGRVVGLSDGSAARQLAVGAAAASE